MSPSDLAQFIEQYHQSIDAIVPGDPEPQKRLWSRGDDVTLANPLGPVTAAFAALTGLALHTKPSRDPCILLAPSA
jgi:hypothetical protein